VGGCHVGGGHPGDCPDPRRLAALASPPFGALSRMAHSPGSRSLRIAQCFPRPHPGTFRCGRGSQHNLAPTEDSSIGIFLALAWDNLLSLARRLEAPQGLFGGTSSPETSTWLTAKCVLFHALTRVAQVLMSLLNNAAKYTPEGGRIWLTADREGGESVIRVRDSGMGIPPQILPKVFDLFTQAERTLDRAEGGLGIGLTLVRRLTEMHNGVVQAFSAGLQRQAGQGIRHAPYLGRG
jgi:hypothetical protein